MPVSKLTRTGLLLFLTMGPLLVFLFLYVFGENQFELDRYPVEARWMPANGPMTALLVSQSGEKTLVNPNEWNRVEVFFQKMALKPGFYTGQNAAPPPGKVAWKPVLLSADMQVLTEKDTLLEVHTTEGIRKKRLPAPPRAFLFDAQHILRGVYGLNNSLSVDTLMLEYKILTRQ